MAGHNLFYFPYASLTDDQLSLLKVAALYFDKLFLLDPVAASWDTVGANDVARDAVRRLNAAGILEVVSPAAVLAKYEAQLTEMVRRDMADRQFMDLCDAQARSSGRQRWTLSLAKVPEDLRTDDMMRQLLGPFARDLASTAAYATEDYIEHIEALSYLPGVEHGHPFHLDDRANDYREYAARGEAYDEYRETEAGLIEYRYADFPLALGEAIMLNHALFAGLLHANATPITDDPFHNQALERKMARAINDRTVQHVLADRARDRQTRADLLAARALTDTQLDLPVLNRELPLETVLEYRQAHEAELEQARHRLGWMARRIETEPWSEEFVHELEHRTIPDLEQDLSAAQKARDSWLKTKRGRLALSGTGIAVGTGAAVLAVFTAPLTPIALAVAGLGLASGTAIPGAEWLLDWRDGKKAAQENGLHYLLLSP